MTYLKIFHSQSTQFGFKDPKGLLLDSISNTLIAYCFNGEIGTWGKFKPYNLKISKHITVFKYNYFHSTKIAIQMVKYI